MGDSKKIGYECFSTMLDVMNASKFNCNTKNCPHDKYRQAADMLSNTSSNNAKLFNTLFTNEKLDCGLSDPKNKQINDRYKNDYTFYSLLGKKKN